MTAEPFPLGLKTGTIDYEREHCLKEADREAEKTNDPTERAAKKARTEAKDLQIPPLRLHRDQGRGVPTS
jgi:hypothetical protein